MYYIFRILIQKFYGWVFLFIGDSLRQKLIKQYNEVDCGIACMQMILNNFHSWISVEVLRDLTETDSEGTCALGIVNGFAKLGINCEAYKANSDVWKKMSSIIP